jgi:hypothetical protein
MAKKTENVSGNEDVAVPKLFRSQKGVMAACREWLKANGCTLRPSWPIESPPYAPRYQPDNCPHCEFDRHFPETADGGWVYMGNNAPLSPCPWCNPHGTFRRLKANPQPE